MRIKLGCGSSKYSSWDINGKYLSQYHIGGRDSVTHAWLLALTTAFSPSQ